MDVLAEAKHFPKIYGAREIKQTKTEQNKTKQKNPSKTTTTKQYKAKNYLEFSNSKVKA